MKIERWEFTEKELKNPANCNGYDNFIAIVGAPGQVEKDEVFVQRNGISTNLFGNGVRGVPDDTRELAEAEESLVDPEHEGFADNWRDVTTNEDGVFLGFAVQVGVQTENTKENEAGVAIGTITTNFSACETLEIAVERVKAEYREAMLATEEDGLPRTIILPVIPRIIK
jgi:hypothetical protein